MAKCSACGKMMAHEKKEMKEDAKAMKMLQKAGAPKKEVKRDEKMAKVTYSKGKAKVKKVMREFKSDKLHSGSKKGPLVHNPKQAIAIALSEGRKAQKRKK